MASTDSLLSPRAFLPNSSFNPLTPRLNHLQTLRFNFTRNPRTPFLFLHRNRFSFCLAVSNSSDSPSQSSGGDKAARDDFVTRVLKENPSQFEPRYLIGGKLYTWKEREYLSRKSEVGVFDIVVKWLNSRKKSKEEGIEGGNKSEAVYLEDILRECKGKLYVPEQVFNTELSEEEEFDRSFEALPKMSLKDFVKAMESDKVKLLTSKESIATFYGNRFRDFTGVKALTRVKPKQYWSSIQVRNTKLRRILGIAISCTILLERNMFRRLYGYLHRPNPIAGGVDFSCPSSKAEARVDGSTGVEFSDVAGIDEAVEELQELVRYLKNAEVLDKVGIKPPHGVLSEGPPNCGKTLVVKAIAGKAGVPFYQTAASVYVEVGGCSARIREERRRHGILKESTDLLYYAATQERETTLNQLLVELDGTDTGKGVVFLAATNRRDLLGSCASPTGSFWSKAALVPARKGHESIVQSDMDDAVDRLTVGPRRIGIELGHPGQCPRATTEMGVATTSHLLRRCESAEVECFNHISIIPVVRHCHKLCPTGSMMKHTCLSDDHNYFIVSRFSLEPGLRRRSYTVGDTSKASISYLVDASWLVCKILTMSVTVNRS
ncbi:putative inactive ATP-dependent zinc metalloprotease FTSHI 1 [Cucumis melo var. makuwa]|uniref:Inactive ATP-dependent zinc metalloprotease FTSHI 1 n=1 Tax=Cucumis melo var. makuwa TaxID=1194695 RepID=A0A5A7TN11_CUCMM|nr:putative inactive ATP-dependent zinc metalloprotease FTSHI 1 [Cucumis melo var. makuwa]TYK16578.1 putative inactive ATP-dependent zinc metalloprotease FTSHI 1 [Cucumis melo var. makuwa]